MNLVKLSLCSLVPILIIFGSLTTITFAQNPALSKTYSNSVCGLSINYPDNWVVDESNMKFGNLYSMAELKPNTSDGFKNIIDLDAEGISEYPDKSIEGIADFMEFYHSPDTGDVILQSNRIDIQGTPAHEIVYEHIVSNGEIWKHKEVYIPVGNTLYTIQYDTVGSEYYDKYISIADNMIQTVKVDGRAC